MNVLDLLRYNKHLKVKKSPNSWYDYVYIILDNVFNI